MEDLLVRRRRAGYAAAFILLPWFLLSGCATVAYQPPPQVGSGGAPALTPSAALRKVRDGLKNAGSASAGNCRYVYTESNVSFTRFSFTYARKCSNPEWAEGPESVTYQYRDLPDISITHWSGSGPGYFTNKPLWIHWMDSKSEYAMGFAEGANMLRYHVSGAALAGDAQKFSKFQEEARAWRALPVKPALTEQVRRCQLLAEDAIKSKNFEEAIDYYDQGLTVMPLWPEGQFNAALIYGELGIYGHAVLHMKRYLELRPDAPDAPSARDQIVIWQAKAR